MHDNPLNVEAYCTYLPLIKANNCCIELTYDPNPNPEDCDSCPLKQIYGESSEETELLRYFRDHVLSQTPEGQEIIGLYYQWSPAIVKAIEEDEEFRERIKEMFNGVLLLIRGVE